jgi:hypothetical protein
MLATTLAAAVIMENRVLAGSVAGGVADGRRPQRV